MPPPDTSPLDLLLPSSTRERDPVFRSVLTDVLHTGLRQCGAIGLVASLLYLGLSVFGLGYDLTWTYDVLQNSGLDHHIVVTGILIVSALSVFSLVLSETECSLGSGRLFGLGAVLLAGAVVTFEGAVRGTFGTEYVILVYLLIVAIVPFRPVHVAAMGGAVAAIVYVLGPSGLAWSGQSVLTAEMAKHLLFVAGGSVLVTGASAILYLRHEAFSTTQAELQKSRDLLNRTQDVAEVGGWEYDRRHDTIKGTEKLYDILGLPEETRFDLETWISFHPEGARAEVRTAIEHCFEHGESFDLEVPLTTARDERRWVRMRGKAHPPDDAAVRLTGILQDITEQYEMETRIRKQEQLLRSITQNVSDGIYRTAPNEGLIYVNPAFARMFGFDSIDDALTTDPSALYVHPEQRNPLLYVREEDEQSAQEVRFQRTNGSTFVGLLGGTVVRDQDGEVQYVDGVVTDITDLKERETLLRRERDRFETLFDQVMDRAEYPAV